MREEVNSTNCTTEAATPRAETGSILMKRSQSMYEYDAR